MQTFLKILDGVDAWFVRHAVTAVIFGGFALGLMLFVAFDHYTRFPPF